MSTHERLLFGTTRDAICFCTDLAKTIFIHLSSPTRRGIYMLHARLNWRYSFQHKNNNRSNDNNRTEGPGGFSPHQPEQ
jgi:hypothetical protein